MTPPEMNLNEVRARGYAALARELGPIGYVRFVQQFSPGQGDYTRERREWLDDLSAEQIKDILARRRREENP